MAEGDTTAFLVERAAELESWVRSRSDASDALMRELPNDPRARVAKLATVLALDALDALRQDLTLDQLARESRARVEASKQLQSQMMELGFPLLEPPSGD
jgi:hypothetical protein